MTSDLKLEATTGVRAQMLQLSELADPEIYQDDLGGQTFNCRQKHSVAFWYKVYCFRAPTSEEIGASPPEKRVSCACRYRLRTHRRREMYRSCRISEFDTS